MADVTLTQSRQVGGPVSERARALGSLGLSGLAEQRPDYRCPYLKIYTIFCKNQLDEIKCLS